MTLCEPLPFSEQLAGEIAAIAADLLFTLIDTATMKIYTMVADGMGGKTESWTTGSTIPIALGSVKPAEAVRLGERLVESTDFISVKMQRTVSLKLRDRLLVAAPSFTGLLEVAAVLNVGSYSILNQVYCTRVPQ